MTSAEARLATIYESTLRQGGCPEDLIEREVWRYRLSLVESELSRNRRGWL